MVRGIFLCDFQKGQIDGCKNIGKNVRKIARTLHVSSNTQSLTSSESQTELKGKGRLSNLEN